MICLVVWKSLQINALVQARYPHEQHALVGKKPNQVKTHVKEDFFNFVDINTVDQQNDSRKLKGEQSKMVAALE